MPDLTPKPISSTGVAGALAKVTHYRYLNQSEEAESICRDVIAAEPENQSGIRMLALVLADQFDGTARDRYSEAEQLLTRLTDPYERWYYTGIVHERRAKAQLAQGRLPHTLRVLFEEAMRCFEEAERIRPNGNDDAILRWNRCVRIMQSLPADPTAVEEPFDSSDSAPI
jgi:tetratricopeptide (TPR) repeat protein